jgi:hypothetical protein
MHLNLEELIFSKHIRAVLFVSLQLFLQLLDLHGEIVNYASVVIGATASGGVERWRHGCGILIRLVFIGRIRFFLEKGWIDIHRIAVKSGCGILV